MRVHTFGERRTRARDGAIGCGQNTCVGCGHMGQFIRVMVHVAIDVSESVMLLQKLHTGAGAYLVHLRICAYVLQIDGGCKTQNAPDGHGQIAEQQACAGQLSDGRLIVDVTRSLQHAAVYLKLCTPPTAPS